MENEFFLRAVRPVREPNAARDLVRNYKCLKAFVLTYTSVKRISFGFHTHEPKYKNFFLQNYKILSCVCRTHKNFQLFIKLLLKISFFAKLFHFLWFTQN